MAAPIITPKDLEESLTSDKYLLVDVRPEDERQRVGYVKAESQVVVPIKDLEEGSGCDVVKKLVEDPNGPYHQREVVVYCSAGIRGQRGANALQNAGLTAHNLEKGYKYYEACLKE
mmetsp:Transcript_34850/g.98322  ORF Transcript_34850/g.98322 Transcript_34850/m.98322 type:complete len:116 (-) Transcript_34850:812-1159(-)